MQERNLRVIEGLMDDVAKADVTLKRAKEEAKARTKGLEYERDSAIHDAGELRDRLAAVNKEHAALAAERDEENEAKVSAHADADQLSEELMYLHSETERQAHHQAELEKSAARTERERNFLQEMLTKSKKKNETDAKELDAMRLQAEAWKRMASTRAPHTDAKHLQWFRQSLLAKKKEGTLDAVEERALEAFESDAEQIFSKTSASGQDHDSVLVRAFHSTLVQNLSVSGADMTVNSSVHDENTHPQSTNRTVGKLQVCEIEGWWVGNNVSVYEGAGLGGWGMVCRCVYLDFSNNMSVCGNTCVSIVKRVL